MRRFRHTDSSAIDPAKKPAASTATPLRGSVSITNLTSSRRLASSFEIFVARPRRNCSNPYLTGTSCTSSCCRGPLRSRRRSNLAELAPSSKVARSALRAQPVSRFLPAQPTTNMAGHAFAYRFQRCIWPTTQLIRRREAPPAAGRRGRSR
jgi:hypothetical protein